MKAVHFGAGNIGRGFVGLLLHEGGYELVFSDVSAPLVEAINAVSEYTVHEVGDGGTDTVVTGFRAIDSSADAQAVIDEVSTADVVTTAVGPTILRFVAPHIVAGLALRDPSAPPLQIMACENAIDATDLLRDEMRQQAGDGWDAVSARAVFANTAADRIVHAQPPGEGVDVTVEPFYEWAIERHPFVDTPPHIPGAHFVDDVAPYIERKLFTVDTGHATTAYYGAQAGIEKISDALADPAIAAKVSATLEETSALLEAVHGLDATELADYRATILRRFANPARPDTVERVGRQPLRKLLSGLVTDDGLTVVITTPGLNLAFFDLRPLSTFTGLAPDVGTWMVGGHSLGGSGPASWHPMRAPSCSSPRTARTTCRGRRCPCWASPGRRTGCRARRRSPAPATCCPSTRR